MAIAVIGGLIVSTLLSLVFVPAVFAVMDDIARWTWRLFGGLVGPADETAHAAPVSGPGAPASADLNNSTDNNRLSRSN